MTTQSQNHGKSEKKTCWVRRGNWRRKRRGLLLLVVRAAAAAAFEPCPLLHRMPDCCSEPDETRRVFWVTSCLLPVHPRRNERDPVSNETRGVRDKKRVFPLFQSGPSRVSCPPTPRQRRAVEGRRARSFEPRYSDCFAPSRPGRDGESRRKVRGWGPCPTQQGGFTSFLSWVGAATRLFLLYLCTYLRCAIPATRPPRRARDKTAGQSQ